MLKLFNLLIAVFIFLAPPETMLVAQTPFWEQTNGPYGGTVNAIAVNSSGPIFVGTSNGGVFRSIDNGDNWTQVNTGLTIPWVQAIAIKLMR